MICTGFFLGRGGEQKLCSSLLLINALLYSTIELKENTVVVVLGASGDLAKKKTVSSSTTFPFLFRN